jgi:hypothetical protein
MASIETFVIQPFYIHRKRLAPNQGVAAKTRHHALADRRRIAAGKAARRC